MKQHTLRLPLACGIALLAAVPFTVARAQAPAPAAATTPSPPPQPPAPPPAPALSNDQASYLFGLTFAEQLHSYGLSNDDLTDSLARGVKEGLQGKRSNQADRQQLQQFVSSKVVAAQARNKTAAQDFLAKNGKEKGVTTTSSGLEYKVIAAGDAKAPPVAAGDSVSVNYRGRFIDGTEFDSSYSRGTPTTFPVGGVIKGWTEALLLMKPGAKYELFVPPELGYGANPRPGIPPNSLLIFDVELLGVKAAPETPPAAAAPPGPRPHPMIPPSSAPSQ